MNLFENLITETREINTPWKDPEGRWNVLVQYQALDSVHSLQRRAQNFIAFTGVSDDRWPDVPVELFDLPEEGIYHYREGEITPFISVDPATRGGDDGLVGVA